MRKYIWTLLILLLIITGCQPASQDAGKNDGQRNSHKSSNVGGLYDSLDIPESYAISDIECPSGQLTIHVDAKTTVPDVPLPIVRVHKTCFTPSQIERFANVLFGNAKRVSSDTLIQTPTKGYLQREIEALQADIASWNAHIQSKYEMFNGKEEAQKGLLKLMEQMDSAPDALPAVTPDYSLEDDISSYFAMPDNQTFSRIEIFQPNTESAELTYNRDSLLGIDDVTGVKEDISGLVTISEEEALALAEQTLVDLELNDFTCAGRSAVKYEFGAKGTYVFYFTRQVNGATETYTNAKNFCSISTAAIDAGIVLEQELKTWGYEQIHVLVDDDGILSFSYTSPNEVTEIVVNQATKLMPFSEIANIFEQNINRIDQPNAVMSYTKDYYITDIVLGLMSIPEKDYETALLTPVWDFLGYTQVNDIEGQLNRKECFFTVNAMDGSIINRSNKYEI